MHASLLSSSHWSGVFELERLEARRLLAGTAALDYRTIASALGNILFITGTSRDDRIDVSYTRAGFVICNSTGWSATCSGSFAQIRIEAGPGDDRVTIAPTIKTDAVLYGGSGVDTLVAGAGNDRLYGGDGRDYLYGQNGDDALVSLGDAAVDRCYGGAGLDGFWTDAGRGELVIDLSNEEILAGATHAVGAFMPLNFADTAATHAPPRALLGQDIPDPALTVSADGYRDFSNLPLFSRHGPRADDIFQGALGDCYLLAGIGSLANVSPQTIRQAVVDLGDGTYCVRFRRGSTDHYIRVDGDLPTWGTGLAYAGLGRQQSLWAAIVEKAYAFFRYDEGSYGSLDWGFMGDVYEHLGFRSSSLFSASGPTALLQQLKIDLDSGRAVTLGTRGDVGDVAITGGHAYMVDAVTTGPSGQVIGVRLRNPWGYDDTPGNGANDGYVTLTAAQALRSFWFACSTV